MTECRLELSGQLFVIKIVCFCIKMHIFVRDAPNTDFAGYPAILKPDTGTGYPAIILTFNCTVRRTLPNSAPTSACRQPDSSHKRKFAFKYVPFIQRKLVLSLERKISLSGKLKTVRTLDHTIYALPLYQLYHCSLYPRGI